MWNNKLVKTKYSEKYRIHYSSWYSLEVFMELVYIFRPSKVGSIPQAKCLSGNFSLIKKKKEWEEI